MVAAASFETVRAVASQLYDAETRPGYVKGALDGLVAKLGAEKLVGGTNAVEYVANFSTVTGLLAGKDDLSAVAAPYLAKARDSDGRKELVGEAKGFAAPYVADAKEIVDARVIQPTKHYVSATTTDLRGYADAKYASTKGYADAKLASTKEAAAPYIEAGLERAAPYVEKGREAAAPYLAKLETTKAKLETKRDELTSGKRYEAAMAALLNAREHPAAVASELRATAVDLIRYDDLRAYRDHVMSAEFVSDTVRLVKVELPAIAASAAQRGATSLKAKAVGLAAELEAHTAKVAATCAAGYGLAADVNLAAVRESLKASASALVAELQAELAGGLEHAKGSEGPSLADALARIKRVVQTVDRVVRDGVLSPALEYMSPILLGTAATTTNNAAAPEAEAQAPVASAASADYLEALEALFGRCSKVSAEGYASSRELKKVLKADDGLANRLGLKRPKDVNAFVNAADVDEDGSCALADFHAAMAAKAKDEASSDSDSAMHDAAEAVDELVADAERIV